VKNYLKEVFKWRVPKKITYDRESIFVSKALSRLLVEKGFEAHFVNTNHHQSNGMAKRVLRIIQNSLLKACA
jgi:transposase InsO family protein